MRSAGLPLTIGYTGHPWDRALGQYFAPFRYYNPATARWNMRDPLGFVDGPNVYAYVAGNPVSSYDSFGLNCKKKSLVGRYRDRITAELDNPDNPGRDNPTTIEVHQRPSPGRDGGRSEIHIERNSNGDKISTRHVVTKDGETVHDHRKYIPKWPNEKGQRIPREFPPEWTPEGGC